MRTVKCAKKARATHVIGLLPLAEGNCWFAITLGSPLHLVASSRNSLFHLRVASYCWQPRISCVCYLVCPYQARRKGLWVRANL